MEGGAVFKPESNPQKIYLALRKLTIRLAHGAFFVSPPFCSQTFLTIGWRGRWWTNID